MATKTSGKGFTAGPKTGGVATKFKKGKPFSAIPPKAKPPARGKKSA